MGIKFHVFYFGKLFKECNEACLTKKKLKVRIDYRINKNFKNFIICRAETLSVFFVILFRLD